MWSGGNAPHIGLEAQDGTVTLMGAVTGHGSAIVSGGTMVFDAASDAQVVFQTGTTGTLALADPENFTGSISGFADGDVIDFTNAASGASVGYAGGVLTVDYTDGNSATHHATLVLDGSYTPSNFALASDNNGGTELIWSQGNNSAPVATVPIAPFGGEILVNTATANTQDCSADYGAVEWRLRGDLAGL